MDWKDIGKKIAGVGLPLLGTALGGPGGGAIGGMVAGLIGCKDDPAEVAAAIDSDPGAVLPVLNDFQAKHRERLAEIALDRARVESEERRANLAQVNETMRAETKSEHWPQYSWRPFNGFLYPIAVLLIYFVLPIAGKSIPPVPAEVWIFWGAILGVATWGRNKEKRVRAGDPDPGIASKLITAIRGA